MNCELLQRIFLRNAGSIFVCISSWHIVFITSIYYYTKSYVCIILKFTIIKYWDMMIKRMIILFK